MGRGRRSLWSAAEVVPHVSAGPSQPALLVAPQCDPNRAPGVRIDRLKNAHRFEHDRDTTRVVRCPGATVPGIHVGSDHHHLIREIGPGDLRYDVVSPLI